MTGGRNSKSGIFWGLNLWMDPTMVGQVLWYIFARGLIPLFASPRPSETGIKGFGVKLLDIRHFSSSDHHEDESGHCREY